jgi:hypothetical protein
VLNSGKLANLRLAWKDLSGPITLACLVHLQVTKKIKCFEKAQYSVASTKDELNEKMSIGYTKMGLWVKALTTY